MNMPTGTEIDLLLERAKRKFDSLPQVLDEISALIRVFKWEDVVLFVEEAPNGGWAVWDAYMFRKSAAANLSSYTFVDYAKEVLQRAKQQHIYPPGGELFDPDR